MFTVQVNVLGRARPLLYKEAVNPDSSVGSIVEMVTGDLSDEETRSFLDAYTFEGTTLFWMKSTPKVTLAIENRTPDMHAISRNGFVEELYLPHRAGVQINPNTVARARSEDHDFDDEDGYVTSYTSTTRENCHTTSHRNSPEFRF